MAVRYYYLMLLLAMSCHSRPSAQDKKVIDSTALKNAEKQQTSLVGNFSDQTAMRFDSLQLDSFFARHSDLALYEGDVRQFYRTRKNAFAWYDDKGQTEQAGNLYNRILNLPKEGVRATSAYLPALDTLMNNTDLTDRPAVVRTELLLTSLYFYFAEKAWAGLQESKTRQLEWYVPRKKISYGEWLQSYLNKTDSTANATEPIFRQYFLLRSYLYRYVNLQQQDWKPLSMDKSSYRPGDSSQFIKELKKRLLVLGDLPKTDTSAIFDTTLTLALKEFRLRMGMKENGGITKEVLSELNVPLQKRINQLLANMERSRWLPDTVRGDYLAINIPEFKLHVYKDDSLLWEMNVVVGKSVHKTVIFSGTLKNVVFSPYWNVPPGILKNEVLPGIKKDKNYLATHHMEWNGANVRQLPGPWNSLGAVKFLFPNSYNIYLHDTPAKDLFGESNRAFSHGCIRLGEPLKLATYLLRNDPAWPRDKIDSAMKTGKEKWVTLRDGVRVYIVYFTAWVDRQGRLNFRKDIYGRDTRLEALIN